MEELNLPSYNVKVQQSKGRLQILDITRKKYVALTPEEWVRQHFINYLISHLHFPKSLIKVEFGIKYNQLSKRPDVLVFDSNGIPLILIECKSSSTKLSGKVLEQVSVYNRIVKSPYTIVTNGQQHICWLHDFDTGQMDFLKSIPSYKEISNTS